MPNGPRAHRVADLKDHGTHNAPFFFDWSFCVVSVEGKHCCFKCWIGCGELKGLGEMISALNMFEGDADVCLRSMGDVQLPICILRISF